MKTAWTSLATRLLVVGVVLAIVSSPFAAYGQWEPDWDPYGSTSSEPDPNGNDGPSTLDADGDGDGSGDMDGGWVWVAGETEIEVSVSVLGIGSSVSAAACGSGYGGGYGSLYWTGTPGQAGNKTGTFYAATTGLAEGETSAGSVFEEDGYAVAEAQSLASAVAVGGGTDSSTWAGCSGHGAFWEGSDGTGIMSGQSEGSYLVGAGTGNGTESGPETWDSEQGRERASWYVYAYGYQDNITGGTFNCEAHAHAGAEVEAIASPGPNWRAGASASGRGWADAYVSIDVN